jgi:hypothetical protein
MKSGRAAAQGSTWSPPEGKGQSEFSDWPLLMPAAGRVYPELVEGSHTLGACSMGGRAGLCFRVRDGALRGCGSGRTAGSSCLASLARRNDKGACRFGANERKSKSPPLRTERARMGHPLPPALQLLLEDPR